MISIISCIAKNGIIGKEGKLPWHIKEDLKWFKEKTEHSIVVMGRNTFNSLPNGILYNRHNIVISSSIKDGYRGYDLEFFKSPLEAKRSISQDYFVIGGASTYKQFLQYADKLYITELNDEYEGDTFFPKWNRDEFELKESTPFEFGFFNVYERM